MCKPELMTRQTPAVDFLEKVASWASDRPCFFSDDALMQAHLSLLDTLGCCQAIFRNACCHLFMYLDWR